MLLATLASVFFAWLAASAARDALGLARAARREQRTGARIQQLERIAALIGEVSSAQMGVWNIGGAQPLAALRHAQGQLAAALAATGMTLPRCTAIVDGGDGFTDALDEVRDRITELEATPPESEPEPSSRDPASLP
jgi:hypothetical protein